MNSKSASFTFPACPIFKVAKRPVSISRISKSSASPDFNSSREERLNDVKSWYFNEAEVIVSNRLNVRLLA